MAKPSPPPRPQLRAGDVVVLRQSQEHVEGEIITVLGCWPLQGAMADGSRLSESGDDSHHGGGSQEVSYPEPPSFQVKSMMLIR